jgi:aryl-alcohol dehydrogenase-like predicted oxidoreductase
MSGRSARRHSDNAPSSAPLPQRDYGTSGDRISVVGFGGIMIKKMPQPRADDLVAEAVRRGVTYFDVAPGYGDAEERLGPALAPVRDEVFLACKTLQRTAENRLPLPIDAQAGRRVPRSNRTRDSQADSEQPP